MGLRWLCGRLGRLGSLCDNSIEMFFRGRWLVLSWPPALQSSWLSRSVPMLSSTLVAHTWAPSLSPHRPPQDFSDLFSLMTSSDQPAGPLDSQSKPPADRPSINPPHPRGDGSLPRSRGHSRRRSRNHMFTRATSSSTP